MKKVFLLLSVENGKRERMGTGQEGSKRGRESFDMKCYRHLGITSHIFL